MQKGRALSGKREEVSKEETRSREGGGKREVGRDKTGSREEEGGKRGEVSREETGGRETEG